VGSTVGRHDVSIWLMSALLRKKNRTRNESGCPRRQWYMKAIRRYAMLYKNQEPNEGIGESNIPNMANTKPVL
jgi:hypothetical protein